MSHLYDLLTPLLLRRLAREGHDERPDPDDEMGGAPVRWPIVPAPVERSVAPARRSKDEGVNRREAPRSAGA